MAMSARRDVELVYGKDNVNLWGNPDNIEDYAEIEARIEWANEYAEQEFLGRIAEGPYDPEEVRTTLPKMAVLICASLAGVHLYDTRRVIDSDESTNRVAKQKKNVDRWIGQIMSGQLKLIDPTTYVPLKKTAQNSPSVANN